ncbi:MAG: AI-2E family transporter [Betaproteobacteria bacterium]
MTTPTKSKTAPPVPVAAAKKPAASPNNGDPGGVIHAPIDVRSTSLVVLACLAVLYFLYWARPVLIPITTAVMLSYALTPIVRWMEKRLKLHKAIGAAITIGIILAVLGVAGRALQPQVLNVLDVVPQAAQKFAQSLRTKPSEEPSAVEKLKKAATEIEQAAATATATTPPSAAPAPKVVPKAEAPIIDLREYLFMGTASLVAAAGQFVVVTCLVYFLLVSGDTFRRALLRVSGDTLTKKKITLQILDEIDLQIQRYLLVQLVTSALLGFICWLIFVWIGLQDALVWGVLGGILHLIPYVGPALFVVVTGIIAFVQFDTLRTVMIVMGITLTMIGLIGMLLVPWLTHKVGRIKAVTVFISLLVWGWLWGAWGLLLGVPIVMAFNAVCERVEDLQPISLFIGYGPEEQPPRPEASATA